MRKRLIPIYSVLVVAMILLAALAPSCGGGSTTGTVVVQATLCGVAWQGAVNYTLTLAGGTSPVSGTVFRLRADRTGRRKSSGAMMCAILSALGTTSSKVGASYETETTWYIWISLGLSGSCASGVALKAFVYF